MATYARLVAMIVAIVCLRATLQTGEWHGPADLAAVGEGHSRLPDRGREELFEQLERADDPCELPDAGPSGPEAEVVAAVVGEPARAASHVPPISTPSKARGPPPA